MIFDPFALVPTDTQAPIPLPVPTGAFTPLPSLLPQLPPNNYTRENGKIETTPTVSLNELLGAAAKQTISPTYEYTFEQEKRYSNPYLQFNPKPLGGYDTEDIYGKFQGSGEQLWNALVKTGATGLSSFVSNFSSFGSSIDSLRSGKPFDEDSYLGQTQGWLKELENDYPNYYTAWEREHPFQSAVTPVGMTNFWGDKVLKNVGFTLGSLASSILVDAGINFATGGTATPATFILAAKQIKNAITPLKNTFRNLSKASTLNKVDDLAGINRVGVGINEGLKTMNSAYNLKKGLQFSGLTYFAAQGEAMIEGYQTYWDTKAKLYEQNINSLTPDKLVDIENTAQEASNVTTALNLPIIMASNLLQFPTIFGGRSLLKQFDSPFLDVINKEGLTVVNNYSRKQAWVNTMKETVKDFATEGGEEGYQYYIGNSVHDYYVDRFNGTATNSLSNYLQDQIPKTVQDEKFWESFVIGGLAGGLMGSYQTVKRNLIGANERTQRAVETLTPIYQRFNSTVKDYVHAAENIEHTADENPVNEFHSAHKALFSTVHDSLRYGIFDNFQSNLEDLRNLPVEEYNKLFQTEFTEVDKLAHLNKIQGESLRIKDDLTQVNKFYQKNPFDSPYFNQRLRDIYKIDQTQLESVKGQLFEDFKELTTYNISRLRNTRGRIGTIQEELTTMGLDDSIIPILYNLDSKEGANEYKRLKAIQLNALKDEVEYYKALEQETPELNLKIKSLEKLLKELDKYNKDLTDSEKESLRTLLFKEELGDAQLASEEEFQKKQEELRKQQEIAVKTAEDLQEQVNQPEKKAKEQAETVAKIIPQEEKKVTQPKINPNIFNNQFNPLNPGDKFKIDLSTESGIFTLLTKAPFVAEKDGIKYQFTPQGVIKYQEGEQRLRYALDNIGLEKIEVDEFKEFVDTGKVSDTLLTQIATKIKEQEKLTDQELAILGEKGKEIESKLQQLQKETPKEKPVKETISQQVKIKEAADKARVFVTSPVKDGIYLIEGDNKFAWRFVDENTAVPLTLKIVQGKLSYSGDMTKGVEKVIQEGYLLDDQYIQELGTDITPLLEEPSFGTDISELTEELVEKKLSLSELSTILKTKEGQVDNLNKFINEPISDSLRSVLEWRVGKGIKVEC